MPRTQPHAVRLVSWDSPWPLLVALLASIPAFYDSLMPQPASWAAPLYVVSALMVLGTAWMQMRKKAMHGGSHTHGKWAAQYRINWVLGVALFSCALLPPSSQFVWTLSWRMLVALMTLLRLIVTSKPLFERAGLARLMAMAAAVLGLCGIGFYLIDPEVTTLSSGLWLAFSTAATVGYGDVVPSTTASRIFSVFVVLLGYGVLSLVTASVAAMFVGSQERRIEREILHDMHAQLKAMKQEIAALRASIEAISTAVPAASDDLILNGPR